MIKLAVAVLCFVLAFASISDAGETWQSLDPRSWVGKYPSDIHDAAGRLALKHGEVAALLKSTLPATERQLLGSYALSAPVEAVDGFIVIKYCMAHDCPGAYAWIIIDPQRSRLWGGFFNHDYRRISTRWYGSNDDYTALPPSIQAAFIQSHKTL